MDLLAVSKALGDAKDRVVVSTPSGVLQIDRIIYGTQDDSIIIVAVPLEPSWKKPSNS